MTMNIDLFDEYASKILAQLYESFPVKTSLDATKLSGHTESNDLGVIIDDDGNESKYFDVARATIEWLWESGYIKSNSEMKPHGLPSAVLTSKGLAVLKSVPKSIKRTDTLGDRLAAAVRSGGKETASELLKAALAKGADIAVGSI